MRRRKKPGREKKKQGKKKPTQKNDRPQLHDSRLKIRRTSRVRCRILRTRSRPGCGFSCSRLSYHGLTERARSRTRLPHLVLRHQSRRFPPQPKRQKV